MSVGRPDIGWWLRSNEDKVCERKKKEAWTPEACVSNKCLCFNLEEYSEISKVLHPRVNVNVEFQGDLEMQALPY